MKIASKCLATRLQAFIANLIHPDQTGFVRQRCITENFAYAAEIVQCYHKRKIPTVVLKLDFQKAFDSVQWSVLDSILAAKNFPALWRRWINNINSSSQTAILLNGVPGNWMQCKKGLRQGDPLSPYLFILVADTLQQLILQASNRGDLRHPLHPDRPCPVLQYADDTLIILPAEQQQLDTLKSLLESFSDATGLHINYHKSTFLPIHVEDTLATSLASSLGCPIATFPQPYLGLPLSTTKLNLADFQPLIARIDKRLVGWRGRLLTHGGRLILVNAVLSALPSYMMGTILLPKSVIEAIDKRRHAFF